jgi:uncharacterized membrane protein YeaQ/YmgE (transglycosylase-associated protein family)
MDDLRTLVQNAPMDLLTQLAAGAVGGNLAAAALKSFSLGAVWNSIAGIIGGAAGAQVLFGLGILSFGDGGAQALSSQVIAGGIGGITLLIVLGLIKSMLAR